jgi:hypothetical protein
MPDPIHSEAMGKVWLLWGKLSVIFGRLGAAKRVPEADLADLRDTWQTVVTSHDHLTVATATTYWQEGERLLTDASSHDVEALLAMAELNCEMISEHEKVSAVQLTVAVSVTVYLANLFAVGVFWTLVACAVVALPFGWLLWRVFLGRHRAIEIRSFLRHMSIRRRAAEAA